MEKESGRLGCLEKQLSENPFGPFQGKATLIWWIRNAMTLYLFPQACHRNAKLLSVFGHSPSGDIISLFF